VIDLRSNGDVYEAILIDKVHGGSDVEAVKQMCFIVWLRWVLVISTYLPKVNRL